MQRMSITVQGCVQGVGFRPFVYALAVRLQLVGFVRNCGGFVVIEVQGECELLGQFLAELQACPPAQSRIDDVAFHSVPILHEHCFRIEQSENRSHSGQIFISPDVATCSECLAELFDPSNRRYRYPFLNCTNCGPRLTIVAGSPYDRATTTMAKFAMCSECRAEYENPADRRFHAQPIACPVCGPRLIALKPNGEPIVTNDPLQGFVDIVLGGGIGALKGLGGFHLVCDARDERAVAELRVRKQRDERPFAVMIRDAEIAFRLCEISDDERALLESHQRPIVLLRKRPCDGTASQNFASGLAPGNPLLGVMLPYTPLHSLLMQSVGDIPLVMTSGNRTDDPIAYLDDDAVERLGGIADVFLTHNRPIHVRCDDSVTRIVDRLELPLRRSRGYAPQPVRLPFECPLPILAVGGQLKNAFALGRDHHAFLSHHLGDLDHFAAFLAFERDVDLYKQILDIQPRLLVHDFHPDYAPTRYAQRRAARDGVALLEVQHHHAHIASCMAENGLDEPVIGVSFDGTGYGLDETIWGGEFLVGDYTWFSRAAHFRPVRLPGGDAAVREPWRSGISQLLDAGGPELDFKDVSVSQRRTVERMIERGFNAPFTSSVGRLFDAVAAITGVRTQAGYEGQAAMQLEWLATDIAECGTYSFELVDEPQGPTLWSGTGDRPLKNRRKIADADSLRTDAVGPRTDGLWGSDVGTDSDMVMSRPGETVPWQVTAVFIDTRPLIRALVHDVRGHTTTEVIARRFHSTVVEIIVTVCCRIRSESQLNAVCLSGGVFLNALLTKEACARLGSNGFRVYRHHHVPPGDGGLSLGQLAIAARCLEKQPAKTSSGTA